MGETKKREIKKTGQQVDQPTIAPTDVESEQALRNWLITNAAADAQWLLAHTDNGIIWGKIEAGKLTTSFDVFPDDTRPETPLEPIMLQACRLFGPASELMLWKENDGWKTRRYMDNGESSESSSAVDYMDESQIMWGTFSDGEQEGFTRVVDGAQDLQHTVPLTDIPFTSDGAEMYRPLRLGLRHYLTENHDGTVSIGASRLQDLRAVPAEEEVATL